MPLQRQALRLAYLFRSQSCGCRISKLDETLIGVLKGWVLRKLSGSQIQPDIGFDKVLRRAGTRIEHLPDFSLSRTVPALRCEKVPFRCLEVIYARRIPVAPPVHFTQLKLRLVMIPIGCALKPLQRCLRIVTQQTPCELVLGFGIALLGGAAEPIFAF